MKAPLLSIAFLCCLPLAGSWFLGALAHSPKPSTASLPQVTSRPSATIIDEPAEQRTPAAGYRHLEVTSGDAELVIEGDDATEWQLVVGTLGPGGKTWPVCLRWDTGNNLARDRPTAQTAMMIRAADASGSDWQPVPQIPSPAVPLATGANMAISAEQDDSGEESGNGHRGVPRTFQFPTWHPKAGRSGGTWGGTTITGLPGWQNERVSVSIDRRDVDRGVSETDLIRVADTLARVALPLVDAWLGPISDVDGDGRLAVLVTSAIDDLPRGDEPLRAFVRGTDLGGGVEQGPAPPIDVIYLNAGCLKRAGLSAVLAHEAAHLAVFSRRREAGLPLRNEEWIDEGLAHAVEWLGTGDRTNLESRWRAFEGSPQTAALEATHRAGDAGWRGQANRGATARFFSFVAAREGVGVLPRLSQSPATGRDGLTRVLNRSFDRLFRDWIVSEWQDRDDLEGDHPQRGGQSPAGHCDWRLAGTTSMGCRLGVIPGGSWCRVRVVGPAEARLQVMLVRGGRETPHSERTPRSEPNRVAWHSPR